MSYKAQNKERTTERKMGTRINTQRLDHFVLQALIDNNGELMTLKDVIQAVSSFGLEITDNQARTSIKRARERGQAGDNGEKRAKKQYKAIVSENTNPLPEDKGDDIVGALDLDGEDKIKSTDAVVMTLSAHGKCRFGELVKRTHESFDQFSESTIKAAIYASYKKGNIQKMKEGRTSIYFLGE